MRAFTFRVCSEFTNAPENVLSILHEFQSVKRKFIESFHSEYLFQIVQFCFNCFVFSNTTPCFSNIAEVACAEVLHVRLNLKPFQQFGGTLLRITSICFHVWSILSHIGEFIFVSMLLL